MDARNQALVLVVLGMICLPAPMYLGVSGDAGPRERTERVYAAEPLDPANASDRATVVEEYGDGIVLELSQVSALEAPDGYRAPEETRRLLAAAMRIDHAETSDPAEMADARRIDREYTYIYDRSADPRQYYEIYVRSNGSVVQMPTASGSRVASDVVAAKTVGFRNLSRGERLTFARILRNSTTADAGYRPPEDAALLARLPALVEHDGTVYAVRAVDRVDPTPSGDDDGTAGVTALSAFGALSLLAGVVLYRRPDLLSASDGADGADDDAGG